MTVKKLYSQRLDFPIEAIYVASISTKAVANKKGGNNFKYDGTFFGKKYTERLTIKLITIK
ncbi:MAG: hypothetical protein ACXWV2_00760 [Chitinophagaceae bacterium]